MHLNDCFCVSNWRSLSGGNIEGQEDGEEEGAQGKQNNEEEEDETGDDDQDEFEYEVFYDQEQIKQTKMNQNLDMFGELGQQVQQIRLENPNLHKQNKINIEDFAPRAPVIETVSKKKKKG